MIQDMLDGGRIGDEGNDPHRSATMGANEWKCHHLSRRGFGRWSHSSAQTNRPCPWGSTALVIIMNTLTHLDKYLLPEIRSLIERRYYARVNTQADLDQLVNDLDFLMVPEKHLAFFPITALSMCVMSPNKSSKCWTLSMGF